MSRIRSDLGLHLTISIGSWFATTSWRRGWHPCSGQATSATISESEFGGAFVRGRHLLIHGRLHKHRCMRTDTFTFPFPPLARGAARPCRPPLRARTRRRLGRRLAGIAPRLVLATRRSCGGAHPRRRPDHAAGHGACKGTRVRRQGVLETSRPPSSSGGRRVTASAETLQT